MNKLKKKGIKTMQNFTYKGFYVMFEANFNGSIVAVADNDRERIKHIFYDYSQQEIKQEMQFLIDDLLDRPITYHREPTPSEIRFGYGATHYKDFSLCNVVKQDGAIKKWLVCPHDGLRYYR